MTAPPADWTTWSNLLRGLSPIQAMPGSDELNRAYLAAQAQQNAAIMNQVGQQMTAQQTNQLRLNELMGTALDANNRPVATDAATRWREELRAQQGIQDTRLRQELAQLMGYGVDARGNVTTTPTLGGRQQSEAEAARRMQDTLRYSELMGYQINPVTGQTGAETLAARQANRQLTSQEQQAEAERQLRERMQGTENTAEMARLQAQLGSTASESAQERAVRERLQAGQITSTEKMTAAEQALRKTLQEGQITSTEKISQAERDLRERLQSGQLSQQESEFARTYLLQQEQSRRQQAELSGYLNGTGGQLTEAGRAARVGEATQRAALAAQLMQSPKDVFRAGAYFRSLRGANPAAMGLGGGGVMGFNSGGERAAIGLPGTITPDDMIAQVGGDQSVQGNQGTLSNVGAPNALDTQQMQLQATAAPTGGWGGQMQDMRWRGNVDAGGDAWTTEDRAMREASMNPANYTNGVRNDMGSRKSGSPTSMPTNLQDDQLNLQGAGMTGGGAMVGLQPGGPVGTAIDSQLGDLGMGAGGSFPGRAAPSTATASPIPYVDPSVYEEPAVKQMTRELRRQSRSDAAMGASPGTRGRQPSGPIPRAERKAGTRASRVEVGPYRFGEQSAKARQNSDERFLRGAALLNQRLGMPGAQPGGPVDAPLWPTEGGVAQPELQSDASLGGDSSFMASAATQQAAPPVSAIGSVDPATQDYALQQAAGVLQRGVGNLGPQTLERMSKTQRGTFEGALEALGLSPEDFQQAYAQTRFANVGNVLSA